MKQDYVYEKLKSENTQFQFALSFGTIPSGMFMKAAGEEGTYHAHEHCQIVKNYCGRVSYRIGGFDITLESGEVLIINSGTPHTWIAMEPTVCLQLGFYPQSLELNSYSRQYLPYICLVYGEGYPYVMITKEDTVFSKVSHAVDNIADAFRKKGLFYDAYIHNQIVECSISLIEKILGENYYHHPSGDNRLLGRILQYIDDNIMREIHIEDVAGAIGFNASYFSDYFKRKSGTTFKKYLNGRRLEIAAGYLKNTEMPVSDIVFLCGFGSMSAFYHNFASQYGLSPTVFRGIGCANNSEKVR